MQDQAGVAPWWAALTVWGVVNAVNILQSVGFLSRRRAGSMAVNHLIGYLIIALAIPSIVALIAFVHASAGWLHWVGPAVFLTFISLMIVVDYAGRSNSAPRCAATSSCRFCCFSSVQFC